MNETVFLCYALERDHLASLRQRIEAISDGAARAGFATYAHVRDGQAWTPNGGDLREILDDAFAAIRTSTVVLLDLTSLAGSKRTGLNIEAGFAKALGKPIVAVWQTGDRPNMTPELADLECSYQSIAELPDIVARLLSELGTRPACAQSTPD